MTIELSESECEEVLQAFVVCQDERVYGNRGVLIASKILDMFPDLDRKFNFLRDRFGKTGNYVFELKSNRVLSQEESCEFGKYLGDGSIGE